MYQATKDTSRISHSPQIAKVEERTFGCVIRQSTTEDIARATGKESPANPPMVAPVPVGTIITAV